MSQRALKKQLLRFQDIKSKRIRIAVNEGLSKLKIKTVMKKKKNE